MKKREISQGEIKQEFDLEELLGYEPSKKQKEMFGQILVNKMVSRTASGDDVNNENFLPYEEKYAEKKGVTINAVDLILEGEMLKDVFHHSDHRSNIVTLEIDESSLGKAYGHISGMEGHPTIKNGKKRDFFGFVNKAEILDAVLAVQDLKDDKAIRKAKFDEKREGMGASEIRKAIFEEIKIEFFED